MGVRGDAVLHEAAELVGDLVEGGVAAGYRAEVVVPD